MRIALHHLTHYRYDRDVALGPQTVRLRPAPHCRTPIEGYALHVEPPQHSVVWERDAYGNHLAKVSVPHKANELRIGVDLVVSLDAFNPFDFVVDAAAERFPFDYPPNLVRDLAPYLAARDGGDASAELRAFLSATRAQGELTLDAVVGLNQRVQQATRYEVRMEPGVQSPELTLERGAGSCRDSSWLLVQALRHWGLAARFVSGYLIQLAAPGGPAADNADLHAWCEVYLPGAGWVGLDPTSGLLADAGHIPLACTPEPQSAAPVCGAVGVSEVEFSHEMSLVRLSKETQLVPAYDEMHAQGRAVREHYSGYDRWLAAQPHEQMQSRRAEAELVFRRVGITFAVYGAKDEEGAGTERLIPFDLIPRIIPAAEWREMERGLAQRVTALNRFLHDVYHGQEILRAGVVPAEQVLHNAQFRPEMVGVDVPGGIYAHIAGIDIVRVGQRDGSGRYVVLEDNLRVPSGVSYMLENRKMMMRLFPDLFAAHRVAPVAHYPDLLLESLRSVAPASVNEPTVVVLTPGMHNSAYFEHAFLAQQMGVELVEGQDLFVRDEHLYMRTTQGPRRVDVIYRRIDDDFLDPLAFRPGSSIGCAGLLGVYRAGNVALCNAIGTGVADDKSIYPYVPKMIEFYLDEKPILDNVPTHACREPEQLAYTLAHLDELVVKEVHGAGGYGMLVGPAASRAQIEAFRAQLLANPNNYVAQPTLALSTCPTYVDAGIAPRHIDLRPFVLSGKTVQTVPGGLTRVALQDGSLVVNSSQGGGTKDTWVLEA